MKTISICLAASVVLLFTACQNNPYEQKGQQVTVSVENPQEGHAKLVRVEVLGPKLFHVSATPETNFSDPKSLSVLDKADVTRYNVRLQDDSVVVIATATAAARVSLKNGKVSFYDKEDNLVLNEDYTTFTPFESVQGGKGYSTHLVFDSPDDEGFFGLGQHQGSDWNWKGKNEELYQYNTKISIPFIYSTKGYGIYIDSYSLCRWGNPNDYSQLNRLFTLIDKDGKEGALTGTYTVKGKPEVVRREDSIYFENLKTTKNLPKDVDLAKADVVYEGKIVPKATGEYKFILYYAGYMSVYINGEKAVGEIWRTAWNPNAVKFSARLKKDEPADIKIVWHPDGSESYCGLRAYAPVPAGIQKQQSWWSEMTPQLDYYYIAGPSADEVIAGYRTLTGKAPVMPRWAMGFWQSRERYKTQDEILSTVAEFRKRNIPLDNIVQDWSYWKVDDWGSHEFEAKRYPDPQAMLDSVHAMHARFMISVWPKFYTSTEHYKEFDQKGWIYQQSVKDSLVDFIWPGYHYGFYDAYAPNARLLFWNQMNDHLFKYGIDAWWMDASEPNVRDCTDLPYRKALCGPTALGPSDQYFNAYALVNAMAIYEGQRSVKRDQRVFLLTRSGFAGLQRYSTASWSGDIGTRWEDLYTQIQAGLNYSISGIPWWTMDIGGFSVEKRFEAAQKLYDETGRDNEDLKEWRELQARWYQFGAFVPLYRAHGQFPLREIWNIAPESHPAYQSILYYSNLRYMLMPYIYSLNGMTYYNDYTPMRPLVMDFANDQRAIDHGFDQYMFGPALMVCPVYHYGDRTRNVYLPKIKGGWYDFYSGKHFSGGDTHPAEAPYERIPLFVRAGSIIPVGPRMQWADEKPADVISLYVYTGDDGSFTLYEDENVNYNYEKGARAFIPISYSNKTNTLTIGDRDGSFPGMLESRTFKIIPVTSNNRLGFHPHQDGKEVKYNGTKIEIAL